MRGVVHQAEIQTQLFGRDIEFLGGLCFIALLGDSDLESALVGEPRVSALAVGQQGILLLKVGSVPFLPLAAFLVELEDGRGGVFNEIALYSLIHDAGRVDHIALSAVLVGVIVQHAAVGLVAGQNGQTVVVEINAVVQCPDQIVICSAPLGEPLETAGDAVGQHAFNVAGEDVLDDLDAGVAGGFVIVSGVAVFSAVFVDVVRHV